MQKVLHLCQKTSRLVIGMMSGTSADGVDAALCRIHGSGLDTRVELVSFVYVPFEDHVRERILALAGGNSGGSHELLMLSQLLGVLYRDACLELCKQAGIQPEEVDLIGSHGQTLWHVPVAEDYLGYSLRGTLQMGDPSYMNEALGCPVISDFRVRDMAAGGLGAPLVPYSEFLLYRSNERHVGLQNIGGIGNLTVLPKGGELTDTFAFDTGPGNMVMDAVVSRITGGAQRWDEGGALAAQGHVNSELLQFLMKDPYLSRPAPKTTGREVYGADYVNALMAEAQRLGVSDVDLLATTTRFTAECIRVAVDITSHIRPERLIIGGGGAQNGTLMQMIRECLPDVEVMRNEELGFDGDAKEAVAFAILANEYLFGNCGNVISATNASHPVVLGKMSL